MPAKQKGITFDDWLKLKPDEFELKQERLALTRYLRDKGLQKKLPLPNINLWRDVLPYLQE